MRRSPLSSLLLLVSLSFIAACASSTPSGHGEDAAPQPIDGAVLDAPTFDAGPPDAIPCVPDPDGESCDGTDDDCDGTTDEGFQGVGLPCEVGVGECVNSGVTICTTDGTGTECGAQPLTPGDELCGTGLDEDCDEAVDEGFPDLNTGCSVGTGECFATGVFVCSQSGLSTQCNAVPGDSVPETCNGDDDDCDGFTDEDFQINQACDGTGDSDLCTEGVWACDGSGGRTCTDNTTSTFDLCGGGDEDCDPTSGDGSEDGAVGQGCDGGDSDECIEGVRLCSNNTLVCTDNTGSTVDLCGGGDDDCDADSADGSEDPQVGQTCDGADTDLCTEGARLCTNGTLSCSDTTGSTVDMCGSGNEDCDGSSADGSEDPAVGLPCDGGDSDLCTEGSRTCTNGSLGCSDNTGSTLDTCNGTDDDCDGSSADGAEDPLLNTTCDGSDGDSCVEGTRYCASPNLVCSDTTGTTTEQCNGDAVDENCNGQVDEGWTRDDNYVCPPYYIGQINGDNSSTPVTDSWYNDEIDVVRIVEDDDGIVYLSGHFSLYSPPGVDFDLYLYCQGCGGTVIQSSQVHSLSGHYDTVDIRNDDDWGFDDSFDAVIEIRHYQSNRCAYWTLTVTGDLAASSNNCDT